MALFWDADFVSELVVKFSALDSSVGQDVLKWLVAKRDPSVLPARGLLTHSSTLEHIMSTPQIWLACSASLILRRASQTQTCIKQHCLRADPSCQPLAFYSC